MIGISTHRTWRREHSWKLETPPSPFKCSFLELVHHCSHVNAVLTVNVNAITAHVNTVLTVNVAVRTVNTVLTVNVLRSHVHHGQR